jgi:membrane-associated phospholipid phosphatase
VKHRVPFCSTGEDAEDPLVPSGHAASAFAFAAGVASEAPVPGGLLIALAALVAYSRVHTGVHYPSDVVAGAVIGAGVSPIAAAAAKRNRVAAP